MQAIEQIQNSTISKVKFTADDDDIIDNVHQLIAAVKRNTSLLTVEFADEFLGCLRSDARSELLGAMTKLQSLQELRIEGGLVMIVDVAEVLCEIQGLKVLTLDNVVLQGVEQDFNAMELTLHQHRSLKEFSIERCHPAVSGITTANLQLAGQKQPVGVLRTSSPVASRARTA